MCKRFTTSLYDSKTICELNASKKTQMIDDSGEPAGTRLRQGQTSKDMATYALYTGISSVTYHKVNNGMIPL